MSKYQIRVYDPTGKNLLTRFIPPKLPSEDPEKQSGFRNVKYDFGEGIRKRAFEVLSSDPKNEYIVEGNWVEFWRLGEPVCRGKIRPLLPGEGLKWLKVDAFSDGVQLLNYFTPPNWNWWDGWDIADIQRAFLWAMKWQSWTVQEQWEEWDITNLQIFGLDSEANSEDLILSKDPENAFFESGEGISPVIERADNEEWYVLEVNDIISKETYIKYYVHSGDTPIPDASWSEWFGMTRTLSETKSWSINSQGGKYLQIKVTLFTEDTETEGMEGNYGYSPVLHSIRVIRRHQILDVVEGDIPLLFNIQATDFKLTKSESYAEILKKLCEKYEIKHWFDCDWVSKVSKLYSSLDPGIDRSRQPGCIFKEGRDIINPKIQFDKSKYCNYLHLNGTDQLYDYIKNDEEIQNRGEIIYGVYENLECKNITQLREEGQEELDKRIKGNYAFEVTLSGGRFNNKGIFPFTQFDWVRIIIGSHKINDKQQVVEMGVIESNDQEMIGLKLNNPLLTTDEVLKRIKRRAYENYYDPGNPLKPKPPVNVFARGEYGYIALSCIADGDEYEWWTKNEEGGIYKYLKTVKTTGTFHEQLSVGSHHWYQVRVKKNGYWSDPSGVVSAIVKSVAPEDLDKTPPAKPVNLEAAKDYTITHDGFVLYRVKLTWDKITQNADGTPIDDLRQYIIERADQVEGQPGTFSEIGRSPKNTQEYPDLGGLKKDNTYYYRVYAIDMVNNPSERCSIISVTIDQEISAPGGEISLKLVPNVQAIRVEITHTDRPSDIAGYEVYASTSNNFVISPNLKVSESFSMVHEFPAEPGIYTWVKVRAYNRSGIPGQAVQAGPSQARLVVRDDIDTSIFITNIDYESNGFPVFSPERMLDLKKSDLYVSLFKNDSIIFEFGNEQLFDVCLTKVIGGNLQLYWSNDKSAWNSFSNTQSKEINGLTRHTFNTVRCRFLKFQVSLVSSSAKVYVLKPFLSVYADYGLFGEIDAGQVVIRSGEKNGERIVQSGVGLQQFARGSDDIIRKVFERVLNGSQFWYNKENGKLMHQFLAETGDWEIVGGKIVIRDDDGNRTVLDKNHLSFFEAGNDEPYWYTKRVKFGICKDGDKIELNWPTKPKVITAPKNLITYRAEHSEADQSFESLVQFDVDNNFTVIGHSFLKGTTHPHDLTPLNIKLDDNGDLWYSKISDAYYTTTTKLTVTIYAYVDGLFGGYAQGNLYYRKEGTVEWKHWGKYAPAHGTTHTYVKAALPPGKYQIQVVKGDFGYWKVRNWTETADIILSGEEDEIMYIAIEGGTKVQEE